MLLKSTVMIFSDHGILLKVAGVPLASHGHPVTSHVRLSWKKNHPLFEFWDPPVSFAHATHSRSRSVFGKLRPTILHDAVTDRQIKCNFIRLPVEHERLRRKEIER